MKKSRTAEFFVSRVPACLRGWGRGGYVHLWRVSWQVWSLTVSVIFQYLKSF